MKVSVENTLQTARMAMYAKKLMGVAYELYDEEEADKIVSWIAVKQKKLRGEYPRGILPKAMQLELYLRSNEHTRDFMDEIDKKELL